MIKFDLILAEINIMQLIYDGSVDPICQNAITISKASNGSTALRFNTSDHRLSNYSWSPLEMVINYDYYVMIILKSDNSWRRHCRILNKKTGMVFPVVMYGPIKYMYYNNSIIVWHSENARDGITIFGINEYCNHPFPRHGSLSDSEMVLLVKSFDNYDLRLVGSYTVIYDHLIDTTDHFNKDGHLVIYYKKQVPTIRGGFEDIEFTV